MKTYDIYAKQDGKWQRKGIQGEPTPPECGGSVEGTAIPVGEEVEKIYFNTNLSIEETNAYLSQLTYVQTELLETPIYVVCVITPDGVNGNFLVIQERVKGAVYFITLFTNIINASWESLFVSDAGSQNNGWYTRPSPDGVLFASNMFYCTDEGTALTDFNGIPIGAENEKIKNVLSITPFGASGGSVDVEDSGLPVEVSTQEEIDALAIGAIFKYTGESGTYENGGLYMVEAGE